MARNSSVQQLFSDAVQRYTPVIKDWLARPIPPKGARKPLLAHGQFQSGKKTLLRKILFDLGYDIVEPMTRDDLDEYRDSGLAGHHAFMIRTEELGTKRLSHVKRAPVVYVCHNPYDYGTKAQLAQRFQQVLEIRTGMDFSRRWGKLSDVCAARDTSLTYWQALELIGGKSARARPELNVDAALDTIDRTDGFLVELVHRSYIAASLTLEDLVTTAEALSIADTTARKIPTEQQRILDTITPIRLSNMSAGSKLVFENPACPDKIEEETDFEHQRNSRRRSSQPSSSPILAKKRNRASQTTKSKNAPKKQRSVGDMFVPIGSSQTSTVPVATPPVPTKSTLSTTVSPLLFRWKPLSELLASIPAGVIEEFT